MPVGATNLPSNLAPAEQANLLQAMQQLQERAGVQAAAGASRDLGKQETSEQVQVTRETENPDIQGQGRGARSFQLPGRDEEPAAPPAEEERPADPAGRGLRIDITL